MGGAAAARDHLMPRLLVGQLVQVERHPPRLPAPLESPRDQECPETLVLVERPARERAQLQLVGPVNDLRHGGAGPSPRERDRPLRSVDDEVDAVIALGCSAPAPEPRPVVGGGRAQEPRAVEHRSPYTARRPASARPSVSSSAYSRSAPTGNPLARRVTDSSGATARSPSATCSAVASPVVVGLVAITTSRTLPSRTRS